MAWILSIAIVLVAAFAFLKISKGAGKLGTAMNILLAKHAWDDLGPAGQHEVKLKAEEILARSSGATWDFLESPPQVAWKYSLIALAMLELGMPPVLRGEKWLAVDKPFDIRVDDPILLMARDRIERVHGVRITLGTSFI